MKGKNVWFISDLHFDHKNILEYSDRPFESVPDMNESIIRNIQKTVKSGDVLIVVGDVSLGAKKTALREYISRIKETGCTLINVRGNHDYKNSEMMNLGFDFACDKLEMEITKEQVLVMHYPYRQAVVKYLYFALMHKLFPKKFWKERHYWDKVAYKEKYLIHGHTHASVLQNEFQFNVSAEAVSYTPINIQRISDLIQKHKHKREKNETSWFRRWYAYVDRFRSRRIWTDHLPRTS